MIYGYARVSTAAQDETGQVCGGSGFLDSGIS